jgi:hypothetical protein
MTTSRLLIGATENRGAEHVQHEITVRVKAPIEEVWNEVARLEDVLKRAPEFIVKASPGDDDDVCLEVRLAWGPISRNVDATAHVETAIPPHQLTYSVAVPSLEVHCISAIDLVEVADDETSLHLAAQLNCGHRQISKLRGMLSDHLEDYVDTTASRVATLAAQHWQSKQRLLFRPGPAVG